MGASPGAPRTLRGMAAMGAARMQLQSTDRRGRTRLGRLARTGWYTLMLVTLALVLALTPALPAAAARATVGGLRANEVSFVGSGGVVLHGTVLAPSASAQRRPGLVMLQGAGNRGRQELRAETVEFPRGGGHRGYAAMVEGSGLMVAWRCSHSMGGR
jgi:poly(3-hydroxybutyrate) depolymerase